MGEVDSPKRDIKFLTDLLCIIEIDSCCAVRIVVVFFPVLHEKAGHFMALFQQGPGCDGRINATRHADNDALRYSRHHLHRRGRDLPPVPLISPDSGGLARPSEDLSIRCSP